MFNSKLIQICTTFSAGSFKKFGAFVDSPYFNKNENVKQLYAILKKAFPDFTEKNCDRTILFGKLFPKETFKEQKLRYVMSDLSKLMEQFIVQEQFENQEILQKNLLLEAYNEKNLEKYFNSAYTDLKGKLKKAKQVDIEHYYDTYKSEKLKFEFTFKQFNHAYKNNLEEVVSNFDIFYLANKLKYCCEIINDKSIFSFDIETLMLDEIMGYLKNNTFHKFPIITIYHQILLTLIHPEEEKHFEKLKAYLTEHANNFTIKEQGAMYVYAQNYTVRKINTGHAKYRREFYELYKEILHSGVLFKDGFLNQWDFKNMATVGTQLGEFEEVEQFIKKYKRELRPDQKETAYCYAMAYLSMQKGNYNKTIELLMNVDFSDVYYYLDSKTLLLKAYFEKGETEALFSLVDAYRVYLRRNKKITDLQREIYMNLVNFTAKLYKVKIGAKNNLEAIKKDAANTKQISNYSWIKEKIAELA